ncbi:hypothetical protein OUZ56_025970 [Daphnia magna]|uniref:Uncharacterized protein n=1 Tax=Daphnia magna TaxID=35525 RepID=A0ABQ9ZKY5_9CRUS|nr:hypothetical protein OUZ56_025970 [Daphnia magna]
MVDVVVCYDQPGSMENAYQRKCSSHGRIFPLVVGCLLSWYPRNDEIRSILGINGRPWGAFRFKVQLAAIQESMDMVCTHFHHGEPNPEDEDIPPLPVETPSPAEYNIFKCTYSINVYSPSGEPSINLPLDHMGCYQPLVAVTWDRTRDL